MAETIYCFDTSAFIESWVRHYRVPAFAKLWRRLEEEIKNGRVRSPFLVLHELQRLDDILHKWAKGQPELFVDASQELQECHEEIINRWPKLIDAGKQRSTCDPWVIALAKLKGYVVVSQENPGSEERPRIPDVCSKLKIRCIYMADYIDENQIEF